MPDAIPEVPQDLASEMSTLGASLFDEKAGAYVVDTLTVDDFYWRGHRLIYTVLREVTVGASEPVDPLARMEARLRDRGWFDQIGGHSYLGKLIDAGVPSDLATVRYHVARVAATSARRRMLAVVAEAEREIRDGRSEEGEPLTSAQLQDRLIGAVLKATREERRPSSTLSAALFRQGKRMEEREAIPALMIGISTLDQRSGGLRCGELGLICGRPGMGKTAIALMQAYYAANHWGPGLLISLEMDEDALALRLLTGPTGFSFRELADVALWENDRWVAMADEDVDRVAVAAVHLANTRHEIHVETDAHGLSRILSLVQRYRLEHDINWLLVDYGQLVRDDTRRVNSRAEEMAAIARTFKQIAQSHRLPVWVLAQPSREVEKRQVKGKPDKLRMSDLGWSGEWEAAANVIWFINPDPEWPGDGGDRQHVVLEIGKSRNGPRPEIPLVFQKRAFRFGERDYRHDAEPERELPYDPDDRAGY